jgi:hypothetical protein
VITNDYTPPKKGQHFFKKQDDLEGPPMMTMYKENSFLTDISHMEDHIFLYERKNP